jgi:uncharacterized membrane protein YkvA (DUF1232 family)
MKTHQTWRERARQLRFEAYAIYLACRDPRTPWYAKLLAACVAGYAFSPIDLIPDFIPVIGYLDDLVLVPLGIVLVRKMIPVEVLADCRRQAQQLDDSQPRSWIAGGATIMLWIVALLLTALFVWRYGF